MNRTGEKGIALILSLILVFVMSVMAISLMFISQTETWSSLNYRLTSQARDGAEAGLNSAANFIVNTYTQPGGAGDPTTAYNTLVSPVTYSNSAVVLSAMSGINSIYPVGSVQSAFNTAGVGKGSITAGNTTVNYATYATLISMHTAFHPLGGTGNVTVQTWKIVSDGTISGIKPADVEVSAYLERSITPTFNYAVFATNSGCSAITLGGGGSTNAYNSATYSGSGAPALLGTNGDVGTYGNIALGGSSSTTVRGDLFTPRTGVGTCSSNNVTAASLNGQASIGGSIVALPQTITYPNPVIPPPGTLDVTLSGATCPTGASAIPGCQVSGYNLYLPPGSYRNITLSGQVNLQLSPGLYNINTLSESGNNTSIVIYSNPCNSPCVSSLLFDPTPGTGAIVMNVAGQDSSGNPVSAGTDVVKLTGNSVQNPSLVSSNFQIQYAGVGNIKLAGGTGASGVVYAPNASYSFTGGSSWYGAVIGSTLTDMGGTAVNYDMALQHQTYIVGPWLLNSFTWKKD